MKKNTLITIIVAILAFSCSGEESTNGDDYFENEEYERAIEAYNNYLKLHPEHVKSLYNRGRSYEELEKYDLSFKDFSKVLEIEEKNQNAKLSLSMHYYRENSFEKAMIYAKEVIDSNPRNADGHLMVARSLHQLGFTDEAMKSYDEALSLNRELGEAYLYRGALKIHLNDYKGACSDFNAARQLGQAEAVGALKKYC